MKALGLIRSTVEGSVEHRRTLRGQASIIGLVGVALSVFGAPAQAQDGSVALDTITVTAQKREQNLQDVPVAISAVTEDGLVSAGVSGTADLNIVAPGLNVTRQLASFAPILRGVGNFFAFPGGEGAVATYVDGVYQPDLYGAVLSLANVDRVEILRGPQGTLFGRNATGGLIHVITKTPSFEPEATLSASLANKQTVEAKFYGATGLTENVAMDLGVFYRNQGDGFGTNLVTGSDATFRNEVAVRSKLLVQFAENTDLIISGDYAESESDLGLNRRPDFGTTTLFGTPAPDNFHDVNQFRDFFAENNQWGVSGKLEHGFNNIDIVGIVSYRETESNSATDQGEGPVQFLTGEIPIETDTFSAELQVKSNNDGWLQWIAGLYYLDTTAGVLPFGLSGPGFIGATAMAPGGPFAAQDLTNIQSSQSIAGFAEVVMGIGAATNLTLGGRITSDDREFTSDVVITTFPDGIMITPPPVAISENFTEPTWRVVLDHKFTDDVLGYVSYSRGFKSGVFNTFSGAAQPVAPEILDSFEIGFKSDLANNRLRLNMAAFYYLYDNLQLTTQEAGAAVLRNAAEAETYGVELEVIAAVSDELTLSGNAAWVETDVVDFPGAEITTPNPTLAPCPAGPPFPNCVSFGNVAGADLQRAPELTFTLAANYERPTSFGAMGGNINFYYNDGFFNDFANRFRQDSYTLLNGTIYAAFGDDEKYRISVFARNIADTEYYSFGTATAFGDFIAPQFGREFGGRIDVKF